MNGWYVFGAAFLAFNVWAMHDKMMDDQDIEENNRRIDQATREFNRLVSNRNRATNNQGQIKS